MQNEPIVIERMFNAPVNKVWEAISNKDEMKKWYFDLAAFKPEVGFEFNFTAGGNGKEYVHLCKVTEAVVNKKLSYDWRYEGHPGNSNVTFELFPEGDKTRFKLIHEGLDSFRDNGPDFTIESFTAGWDYIINTSLKGFVEKL